MSMQNHIAHLENVISRNKWVFTALLSVSLIATVPLYLYTVNAGRMSYCIDQTDLAIERLVTRGETYDGSLVVRRSYYECIARQGIDVRSVPSFDELYNSGPADDSFSDEDSWYQPEDGYEETTDEASEE